MQTMKFFPSLGPFTSNPFIGFILRPLTITRIVTWIFSVIVCGSLMSGGFQNVPSSSKLKCVLNENPTACEYGVGIGFLAATVCLLFLLLDISEPYILHNYVQKFILIADILCSVICAALWLIGFCFLAHQWALSIPGAYPMGDEIANTTLAFSFFSIPCWVVLSILAFIRFHSTIIADYKRSLDEAILPVISRLSSSSNGQVHALQISTIVSPYNMSVQDMNNNIQA